MMSAKNSEVEELVAKKYRHGFVTDIESDTVPPGLDEDVIRLLSRKKGEPQFMLDWRLKAYRHWLTMREPNWAKLNIEPIKYQEISYYSAPKNSDDGPKSLEEVDPKLLETYDKLGIPLHERAALAGVAVDAVFDSVSVTTTFRDKLADAGFDPVYGARPLKRAIQQQIENPLAQEILQGRFNPGDTIAVGVAEDQLEFQNAA